MALAVAATWGGVCGGPAVAAEVRSPGSLADRAACSTLAQAKKPTDQAFKAIAGLGFKWLDLSCLNWATHVSVPKLVQDFEQEAGRIETLLATNGLGVANLTFDAPETRPFPQYVTHFTAVVRLAARLKAQVVNIMAPSAKADREKVAAQLRQLVEIASRSGVTLTLETHTGQITEWPTNALWLCQQVPGLGLTLDPSHYYAGPNQGADFAALYPLARGTGLRAGGMSWAQIQLPWGEGPIDFAVVVRRLEAAGYKGYYAAEYIEGFNQVDALEQSRRFLEWMRQRQ